MAIRIILVDDHKIMREGLKNLLKERTDMKIIGEAENGRVAVSLAEKEKPDIVIMDIGMPDMNGITATSQILGVSPDSRIIALSMYSGKQFVSGMFKAGASGYLLKDCATEELVDAIKSVHSNHIYLSRDITDIVIQEYTTKLESDSGRDMSKELTGREIEVLQLIAEGIPTREIAEKLFLSVKTVETHRQHIMQKLNLFSVPELTKYAIREGYTSLDT